MSLSHDPAEHVTVPVLAQAPVPQDDAWERPSSINPLQSLSMLSHVSAEAVPGIHESVPQTPSEHVFDPVLTHGPVPQVVVMV